MTRRITQTFRGFDQPIIVVTLPDDHDCPGEHDGVLRAWAIDDEDGEWWGLAEYYAGTGQQYLGWLPSAQLRRNADLTDDDGLVDGKVVPLPQRDT